MEDVFKKHSFIRSSRFIGDSKLHLPFRKHDYGKNCLSYQGATIWNGLRANIKEAKSCNSFKHAVKANFFEKLKHSEENNAIH